MSLLFFFVGGSPPLSSLDPAPMSQFATLYDGNMGIFGNEGAGVQSGTRGTVAKSTGRWQFDVWMGKYDGLESGRVGLVNSSHVFTYSGGVATVGADTNGISVVATEQRDVLANNTSIDRAQNGPLHTGGWPYPITEGTVVNVVVDFGLQKVWFGRNGNFIQNGAGVADDPSTNAGGYSFSYITSGTPLYPAISPNRDTCMLYMPSPATLYGGAQAWDTASSARRKYGYGFILRAA